MRGFDYGKEGILLPPGLMQCILEIQNLERRTSQMRQLPGPDRVRENLTHIQNDHYRRAWEYACKSAFLPFTEETLWQMHHLLIPELPPGYKRHDNFIVWQEQDRRKGYAFLPPSARETPMAMEALLDAYHRWEQQGGLPALGMIGCFLQDFICIHPFPEGNGRMARLLLVLLLLRSGFSMADRLLLEDTIRRNRGKLIAAERQSQMGWYAGTNDYLPIMAFYLDILGWCYQEMLSHPMYQSLALPDL